MRTQHANSAREAYVKISMAGSLSLLSGLPRNNAWTIAAHVGDANGMGCST
jgi:hypothetical protein